MSTTLRRIPFKAMGSHCEIQFMGMSRIEGRKKLHPLLNEVQRLERKYSRYDPDSYLSEINLMAGNRLGIKIDAETRLLLAHARSCFEQSDGLFDITSGLLRKAWDFTSGRVPDAQEIEQLLPHIGFDKLEITRSRLIMPTGMEIDFGGIVKEYAADSLARMARNLGIESGLVNLGGDFAVIGQMPGGHPWPVGIVHPDKKENLMARLTLNQGGLASSGDYERFFLHEGKRYSHLLNPKTGWPSDGLRAVSVAAELCTLAGTTATIAMLKPEAEGIAWLQELGLDHVYMTADGTIDGQGMTLVKVTSESQLEPQSSTSVNNHVIN